MRSAGDGQPITERPERLASARILCLTVSQDEASQYMALMNSIFAAQVEPLNLPALLGLRNYCSGLELAVYGPHDLQFGRPGLPLECVGCVGAAAAHPAEQALTMPL